MPNLDTEIRWLMAALQQARESLEALRLSQPETTGVRDTALRQLRGHRQDLNAFLQWLQERPPKEE